MKTETATTWAVELTDFAKSYRPGWGGARIAAVHSLSLQLAPGQVLGLLGPNGSGKSTTLRTLAGLMAPTAGTCRIFGHPAGSDEARAMVGYLPESPQFSPHLSGREYLDYCAALSSVEPAVADRRVGEMLAWSGLGAAGERKISTYSKGMLQRLGLAQALVHDPALVLLDEPASGLDPAGRLALGRLIRDLATRGKTVVFSSHLLTQAGELCDRLGLLGRGRLLAEGTPEELLGTTRPLAAEPSPLERLYLEKIREHE